MLAFPVTPTFTDDFNRANANPAGAPWLKGDNGSSVTDIQISSNQFTAGGGTTSISNSYLNDGSIFADFDAYWVFARAFSGTQQGRILGRIQTPGGASSGYHCSYAFTSGAPLLTLGTYTRSGANPSFPVSASASAPANAAGHALGLRIFGATLYGFYFDGTSWDVNPRVTWTDPSSLYGSGPVGIGANTSSLSTTGDNFNVGAYSEVAYVPALLPPMVRAGR
jgi:hypothetical protein